MMFSPPVLFAGAAVAQRALAGRLRTSPLVLPALPLFAGAGALAISAVTQFRHARTTTNPVHPERVSSLVTDGVFHYTRHPMYLALAGVLVAHAVFRRSLPALLPVAGFVWAIDRWQIPTEETALDARFGTDYRTYADRVPRWLPRV